MNVSTSANWNRPPVGIVRVEQELFKALAASLGKGLTPCVFSDGKFVRYRGSIGTGDDTLADDTIVWPDPSYDFPTSSTLELVNAPPRAKLLVKRPTMPQLAEDEIGFDDILISVGLDWDWERERIDAILYDLRTKKNVKVVTCCYDLIPVLFPHYCVGDVAAKFKEYFTNLTWASSAMLCISRQSEADYKKLALELGMPEIPTRIMLLGNKLPEAGEHVSEQISELSGQRFILFVSTIERRKNHEVIYKALHVLAEEGRLDPDLKVVFVGMPGWGVGDLLKDIELDPLTQGHILQFSHVNDAELRLLYHRCEFFVYPSLYEGWGLPVAEALAFGKFVLASDRGSIPEVGGDLVEYVDPWNVIAWADAIHNYFANPKLVLQRSERIHREYRPVHWDETASAVVELIDSLCAEKMDGISVEPGHEMQTVVGVCYGSRIVSNGVAGIIAHGPYQPLPAGRIKITAEIETVSEEGGELLFAFGAERGKTTIKKEKRAVPTSRKSRLFRFDLRLDQPVDDFEIVVTCPENLLVSLNYIEIHRVQDQS